MKNILLGFIAGCILFGCIGFAIVSDLQVCYKNGYVQAIADREYLDQVFRKDLSVEEIKNIILKRAEDLAYICNCN